MVVGGRELHVDVAQALGERVDELPQQQVAERGLHHAVLPQGVAVDAEEVAEALGDDVGRARLGVDQRQLAEVLTLIEHGDLVAIDAHPDLALDDDIQLVADLALAHDHLAGGDEQLGDDAADPEAGVEGQLLEEEQALHGLGAGGDRLGLQHGLGLDGDDGDVVAAAAVEGLLDEPIDRGGQVGLQEQLEHVLRGHHVGQAVAAQQDAVAVEQLDVERVGAHVGIQPDGSRDDVAVARCGGVFPRHGAGADELIDHGVVFRELPQLTLADQVGARVADVDHKGRATTDHGGDQRGGHALAARSRGRLVDAATRRVGCLVEQLQDVVAGLAVGIGGERVDGSLELRRVGLEGVHRDGRGQLARLPPTDTVGDDEHAEFLGGQQGIFVVLSLEPNVGTGVELQHRIVDLGRPPTITAGAAE